MAEVMERLQREHRNFAKILRALEHQLAIFDRGEQPDYDVLAAIAEYFTEFPDRCHHPKEDLIYRKLGERSPAVADSLLDLEAEHEKISALARHFHEAVQNVLMEAEVPRSAFEEVTRHFIREQRHHMQMEEEHFFPKALEVLTPEDWADIDAQVVSKEDPVFGAEVTQEFAALRDRILEWEREDEALEG